MKNVSGGITFLHGTQRQRHSSSKTKKVVPTVLNFDNRSTVSS